MNYKWNFRILYKFNRRENSLSIKNIMCIYIYIEHIAYVVILLVIHQVTYYNNKKIYIYEENNI